MEEIRGMSVLFQKVIEDATPEIKRRAIEKATPAIERRTLLQALSNLIESAGCSLEKAMDTLRIAVEDRPYYRAHLPQF